MADLEPTVRRPLGLSSPCRCLVSSWDVPPSLSLLMPLPTTQLLSLSPLLTQALLAQHCDCLLASVHGSHPSHLPPPCFSLLSTSLSLFLHFCLQKKDLNHCVWGGLLLLICLFHSAVHSTFSAESSHTHSCKGPSHLTSRCSCAFGQ